MNYKQAVELIDQAKTILVIQAENPDGDSLASSLALEEILSNLDKEVLMYCPVDIPVHLRHISGWDRVVGEMPKEFDLSIIVDTSATTLLEKAFSGGNLTKIKQQPLIIIDHHNTDSDIDFASVNLIDSNAVATSEVIYDLAQSAKWELSLPAMELIVVSIMYDSLGLISEGTTPKTIRIVADLVEAGVSLAKLDALRREASVRSLELTHYKGKLLQRVELLCDDRLALIHIPWEEIHQYSNQYNPSMLVIDDMRYTEGVKIAVALKTYPDGRITGKLRANYNVPVAAKIAERFGGGGHVYAAGFKTRDLTLEEVRTRLQQYTAEALNEII